MFLENIPQVKFTFEKVIDSSAYNDFVPFISYQKKIQIVQNLSHKSMSQFNNFMM